MARKILIFLVVGGVNLLLCPVSSGEVPHMINYQGKLTTASGGCLNDTVQMTFSIYPDTLGSPADWTEMQMEVIVKDGIFNVLLGNVDTIPAAMFDGSVKYLGVQVESDPEMRPLKPMVSVAYAYRSVESDTAQFALSGAPDDDWDVDTAGLNVYRLTGNVGIGTPSPGEKLEVVGNIHASGSITSGTSLTIDGTNDKITATSGTIDFDDENLVTTGKATIGPGHTNAGVYAFVAGQNNATAGWNSTVGGGRDNMAGHDGSTVGGGVYDTASGIYSTVSGGAINVASGQHGTVGGGNVNLASGNYSTVSGGGYDTASGTASSVGGGGYNVASGDYATIGGGFSNRARGHYSVVSGGGGPTTTDSNSAIGDYSTVGGGQGNIAGVSHAAVGGGYENLVQGDYSAIPGGYADTITSTSDYSYLFGIGSKLTADSTFMIDMPHIHFGDETNGYEFPTSDGSNGQVMATDGNGQLSWLSVSGGGGGWVDDGTVVRLQTSTDSVGIGTASPGTPLQVGSGSHAPVFLNTEIQIDHDDAASHRMEIRNNNGATGWSIDASGTTTFGPISATKDLYLLGGNSVRMTVNGSSGNVGIGTTNPGAPLQVGSGSHAPVLVNTSVQVDHDDASDHNIEIRNNSGATGWRINAAGSTTFGPLSAGQDLYLLGGNSTRMTIDGTSGNVGIGTSSPQGALDVSSTTGALIVPRMTTAQRDALSAVNGMIIYNTTTNQFNFYENGAWVTK